MRAPSTAAIACLAAIAAGLAPDPAHAAWQHFQQSVGGLSNNSLYSIAEAPDGSIWIGTGVRAADHFDGSTWTSVVDSLPLDRVQTVVEDHAGRRWFGTAVAGLAMFDGSAWHRFNVASGQLPNNAVNAILEDHRGDLWFGTEGGLARLDRRSSQWTTYLAAAGGLVANSIRRLFEDDQHRLWIATAQGVSAFDSTRSSWTSYVKTAGALEQDSLTAVCQDKRGRMWFGTLQGVYVLDGASWQHLSQINGLPNDYVLALARDSTGRMWMGGTDGVVHTDGVTYRADSLTSDNQLIGPVQSLLVDSSGNLWMGGGTYAWLQTQAQGLFRYDGVSWQNDFSNNITYCPHHISPNIPHAIVLPSNCIVTGMQDHAGDRWFATSDAGVAMLDHRGTWSAYTSANAPLLPSNLSAVAEDGSGTLWFGSLGGGTASLDATRSMWQAFHQAGGLAGDSVTTLFTDHAGDLWVGTSSGLSHRTAGSWVNVLNGAPPDSVQSITEDASHQLWIMTNRALYSIDATRTSSRAWTTTDGLPDNVGTALLAARDGSVWFGTGRGLAQFSVGIWRNESIAGDSAVTALGEDATGEVVAGTNRQLAVWNGGGWSVIGTTEIAHPTTTIATDSGGILWAFSIVRADYFNGRSWHHVDGEGSGLANDATNSTFEDVLLSRWFTSYGGLAEYQPDRVAPQTLFVLHPQALSPLRSASFAFGAAYGEVADVEFSYSWDGAPWSPWSALTTFNIAGVPDGLHTFQVRSRDWANNVDPTPASLTFEVDATPPPAEISSPAFGQPVRGRIAILGTAVDPRFHDFSVAARVSGGASWSGPGILVLGASTSPVKSDTLAIWDTTKLPDGNYDLRLAVTDTLGLVGAATLTVIVDNVAPFANVTSPVRLVARTGGDVYTTNAEVHAYFPPNGFDADPLVTVDSTSAGAPPDTLPGGELREGAAWTIGWSGANMRKSGTLELRPWAGGAGAIWRDDGASGWTHLGGSPQPGGALAIDLAGPGRYALFSGGAVAPLPGGLSGLTLTPRAFSPKGNFASSDVAIGFTLARSGDFTVKLYNRAGRLVRSVARGAPGTPGANLVRWDGRGDDGHVVEPGLYLVTVEALGETRTQTLGVVH